MYNLVTNDIMQETYFLKAALNTALYTAFDY